MSTNTVIPRPVNFFGNMFANTEKSQIQFWKRKNFLKHFVKRFSKYPTFDLDVYAGECAILYDHYGPGHPKWDPSDDSQKTHAKVGSWTLTGSGQDNELSRVDVMPGRVLKDFKR